MSIISKWRADRKASDFADARFLATVIASVSTLAIDVATPVALAIWLLQVTLVWTTSLWANVRQMMAVAAVCIASIVLGFLFSSKQGLDLWVSVSNVLLSLGAVWAIAQTSLRRMAAEESRRKSTEELNHSQATIRMLSNLLPICAWCKKIRNELGSWEDLETYVASHSNAQVTHGICQVCAARASQEPSGKELSRPSDL